MIQDRAESVMVADVDDFDHKGSFTVAATILPEAPLKSITMGWGTYNGQGILNL
jgi:hypothetical protein